MKKEKITIEQIKDSFLNIPYGGEFTRAEIIKIVTDLHGDMEVIPSDYCYNRVNKGIDIEKNLKENNCLFEYISRNRYKYIGTGQCYSGDLYHQPKGCVECICGKINKGVVEWLK